MKKTMFCLFLIITSCTSYDIKTSGNGVIISESKWGGGYCVFQIYTLTDNNRIINGKIYSYILDSCGKFNIGDTVGLRLEKR